MAPCSLSLLAAGLVTEGIYLVVSFRLSWVRYGECLRSWREILGGGSGCFVACLIGVAALLIAYLAGWQSVRDAGAERAVIWGFATLFAVTLFWLLPITSDLFGYLVHSHVFTDLGGNPLLDVPLDLAPDGLVSAYPVVYAREPSAYGPVWALASAPATVGSFDVTWGLIYLKGLATVAYLGSAWLLERILRNVRPSMACEGLYLFAWNPLVLLMAVGDGHNDIVMMAAVLLAVWWLLRQRWTLSFVVLMLSVWIKYISLIFLPIFVLHTWHRLGKRQRGSALVRAGLAVLGISVMVMAPFWQARWPEEIVERLFRPANWRGGDLSLAAWSLAVGLVMLVVVYAVLVSRMHRELLSGAGSGQQRLFQRLLDVGFAVSLSAFVLGMARSQPWHLIWPVAWAGLSSRRWAWPVLVGLSAVMLVVQLWVEWGTPGIRAWS